MHLQQGAEFPKVPELTSVIEGLQKELPSAQNAKKAVSITLFKEGCAFLYAKRQDEPLEVRWIQWKVIWIFGFLGYLRSDDAFRLNVKDVEILETGVKLTFRSSKTDPKGEGQAIFLGESEHPWYSPVSAARDWLHSLQAKPNEFGPDTPWMRKVNAIKGISYVEEGRLPKAAYTTIVRLLITKIAPSERVSRLNKSTLICYRKFNTLRIRFVREEPAMDLKLAYLNQELRFKAGGNQRLSGDTYTFIKKN